MKEETVRFTVSLPRRLLAELDRRLVRGGYSSRSEVVRDLIRGRLEEDRWEADRGPANAVLTILYDHHRPGLTDRIVSAQHDRRVNVLCSTHVHVSHRLCLEAIILRGRPREIRTVALTIGGLKGVQSARLSRHLS